MMIRIRLLAFWAGLLLPAPVWAQVPRPTTGKPESWVKPVSADLSQNAGRNAEGGIVYLLFDRQVNVERHATYSHYVYRIVDKAEGTNRLDFRVDFDPSFQKICFHRLTVQHNDKTLNLLETRNNLVSFRRETQENGLDDGMMTHRINLNDIPEGSTVEIAYTETGHSPVLGDRYAEGLYFGYPFAVKQLYFSVLTPHTRSLNLFYNQVPTPLHRVSREGKNDHYEWDLRRLPALKKEDHLPAWYTPEPYVMLSEYRDWAEVVQFFLPLFRADSLQYGRINRLYGQKIDPTDKTSVQRAIRFVQDEINYGGYSGGIHAFKPDHPETVFMERLGDCKDKSQLLVTLLRGNGIEAYPLLVNTLRTRNLPLDIPSPQAFDHCIVYLRIGGKAYYVDPTINLQGGSLDRMAIPPYQYGLLLREGETGLHRIPPPELPTVIVHEYFTLDKAHEATDYKIVTRYEGAEADLMRVRLAQGEPENTVHAYREYRPKQYSLVKQKEKPEIDDAKRDNENVLAITEHYTLKKGLWDYENGQMKAVFLPWMLKVYLAAPDAGKRTMPYDLGSPVKIIQKIEVRLPQNWPHDYAQYQIKHPAFEYSVNVTVSDRVADITYTGIRTGESVAPEEFETFRQTYRDMETHMPYTLDNQKMPVHENGPKNKFEAAIAMAFLIGIPLFMLCVAAAIVLFFKYDPAPLPVTQNPGGIEIVLSATAIGLVLDSLFHFADTVIALALVGEFAETDSFAVVALRILFFALDIVLFVLSLLTTVYFLMRRSGTRNLFVLLVCLWVMSAVSNIGLAAFTERSGWFYVKEVFRILLFVGLWGPFFILGSQTRGVFVKQLKKSAR